MAIVSSKNEEKVDSLKVAKMDIKKIIKFIHSCLQQKAREACVHPCSIYTHNKSQKMYHTNSKLFMWVWE